MNIQREKHTHTRHQMEEAAGLGLGVHDLLTHREGLAELHNASCKRGRLNLLTTTRLEGDPGGSASFSGWHLHPPPTLRGSRSLSAAPALGRPREVAERKIRECHSVIVAGGGSLLVRRHFEDAGSKGCQGREETGARAGGQEMRWRDSLPPLPPNPTHTPQITCPHPRHVRHASTAARCARATGAHTSPGPQHLQLASLWAFVIPFTSLSLGELVGVAKITRL